MRVKNYILLFVKETIYVKISIYKILTRSSTSLGFPRLSDFVISKVKREKRGL